MIPNSISVEDQQKLGHELARILGTILTKNEKVLNDIDKIKTISEWYLETGKHPDQVPSIVINQSIDRLVGCVTPSLTNYLVDKIKIEIETCSDGLRIKVMEISFAVKPYVEFIKKVTHIESNKVRVTFSIVLTGKLEGMQLHRTSKSREFRVEIDRMVGSMAVSIIRVVDSLVYVPAISFNRPVVLYNNEFFKVEGFHL